MGANNGWTPAAQQDLLIALVKRTPLKNTDLHELAADMAAKGYKMSWDAIRQHLQKLKKKEGSAIQSGVGSGGEGSSTPAPKTPGRKRAPASKKTTTAPKSGGKRKAKVDDEASDDDIATPSKKTKSEPVDTKTVPKKEDPEDSADGGFAGAYAFDGNNYII
ncbi:hypothetical protein DL546_006584 [Coniochaeta pulveracea]|uniref:Uncharacterized protein n=1 Tax=Coniochaeta pulveracea TaxID=177199 RepID=A0A420YHN3_9PEZI|nr:hypothetical protein DL546_006584 [Coniochaeta pulveracea]